MAEVEVNTAWEELIRRVKRCQDEMRTVMQYDTSELVGGNWELERVFMHARISDSYLEAVVEQLQALERLLGI